jgi:uncharacterized protein
VNLRDKLARLPAPPAPVATAPERADVLEALRRKMSEILQRPIARPRPPADPSRTELPFVREDSAEGPIYRRFERLLPSRHVGRMPLDAAASAKSEMLALLALDPGLAGCDVRGALFLDTETTGLGGGQGSSLFWSGWPFSKAIGCAWSSSCCALRRMSQLCSRASSNAWKTPACS